MPSLDSLVVVFERSLKVSGRWKTFRSIQCFFDSHSIVWKLCCEGLPSRTSWIRLLSCDYLFVSQVYNLQFLNRPFRWRWQVWRRQDGQKLWLCPSQDMHLVIHMYWNGNENTRAALFKSLCFLEPPNFARTAVSTRDQRFDADDKFSKFNLLE